MPDFVTQTGTHDDSLGLMDGAFVPNLPYLFAVLEADRPAAGGARYSLVDVDEVAIGRGADRTARRAFIEGTHRLELSVPGRAISAKHARLFRRNSDWILEDTESKNGTFTGQRRIERTVLRDGDVFEAGHAFFRFRAALPSPDGPSDLDSRAAKGALDGTSTLLPGGLAELKAFERIASSPLSVLLLGETGTGKEVLARALHSLSGRSGPFVAVNCGALSPNLVESQLFGHVKGAFSGATREEEGAFRAAEGGTLLLDEIGDLPKSAQPALLRVLQECVVTPVGSARARQVDVRVVAATHQPIADLTESGDFRLDVLARLSGFVHTLPNLRDRREDLGLLIAALLNKLGRENGTSFSVAAGWQLLTHAFSANIRELEQALGRATTLATQGRITPRELCLAITEQRVEPPEMESVAPKAAASGSEFRAELVAHFERHQGNVADVARALGRSRVQVYRWLERYEIDPNAFRR